MQGLIRVAVEPQIPVETILGYHDFDYEGFDHRFGYILPLVDVGVLFQGVLKDGELSGLL